MPTTDLQERSLHNRSKRANCPLVNKTLVPDHITRPDERVNEQFIGFQHTCCNTTAVQAPIKRGGVRQAPSLQDRYTISDQPLFCAP
tara:strand:- start:345 stop:605 length:261 start_codon:yes stop_codon:yes gene_type:complete